jgi:shikimate dehydrogenase
LASSESGLELTRRYAVLGSPIEHSKSPIIHNTAFSTLGVAAEYARFEVSEDLRSWLASKSDFAGFSVTMPLKKQALDLAERADPLAIATQSANTLLKTETGWDAYNTDVFGIQQALKGHKFSSVCVLGTGATARSAIVAMLEAGKRVSVWGRDSEKVKRLCAEFEVDLVEKLHIALSQPAVISTVVAGALDDQIRGEYKGVLLDVVYNPWPTKLAQHFSSGTVVSGLEMLLWQAIGQQRLFNGLELDEPLDSENKMIQAVRSALSVPK